MQTYGALFSKRHLTFFMRAVTFHRLMSGPLTVRGAYQHCNCRPIMLINTRACGCLCVLCVRVLIKTTVGADFLAARSGH